MKPSGGQPVAHPRDGLDDAVAELLAEVPHVDLDDVGAGVEVVVLSSTAVLEVDPVELARLIDTSERPRVHDWSFRAALTRYAQPQPQRASDVIELLRRIESALRPHGKLFEQEGAAIWDAVSSNSTASDVDSFVVESLRALRELDRLGDVLAEWAVDRQGERPDATVDAIVAEVARRLEGLGIPHGERQRRPRP
jgi:hypothetical protein